MEYVYNDKIDIHLMYYIKYSSNCFMLVRDQPYAN